MHDSRRGIGDIKALWSTKVVNDETRHILNQAFRTYQPLLGKPKVDRVQLWPGTNFDVSSVEGQAILGMDIRLLNLSG